MAEIVAVHDLEPVPRTAQDIIPATRPGRGPGSRTRPKITGKWLAANVTNDVPAVIAAMFDQAERRDPAHERTWVALVDGNNQQINAIGDQATARGVTVTIVIDFVHMLEYTEHAEYVDAGRTGAKVRSGSSVRDPGTEGPA